MSTVKQLPLREDVPAEQTWNKVDAYPSEEAWEVAF